MRRSIHRFTTVAALTLALLVAAAPAQSQEITAQVLPGFGGAVHIPGFTVPVEDRFGLFFGGVSGVPLEAPFTIELIGRVRELNPATLTNFTGLNIQNTTIHIHPDGLVRGTIAVETSQGIDIPTGHHIGSGETFYVAVTLAADGQTYRIYAAPNTDSELPYWQRILPAPHETRNVGQILIGSATAAVAAVDVWEARFWNVAKTQDELEVLGDGPILDPGARPDLVELWRFEEMDGALMAPGEKGVFDLTAVGTGMTTWGGSQCTTMESPDVTRDECSLRVLPAGQDVAGRVWCIRETCLIDGGDGDACWALAPFGRESNPSVDPGACAAALEDEASVGLDLTLYLGELIVSGLAGASEEPPLDDGR